MELLFSNFPPAKITESSFPSFFEKELDNAEKIKIASGYVSSDSLVELKRVVEINKKPHIELLIGMHYFEGFTKTQYEAAKNLNDYLRVNEMGSVSLATTYKFHGKIYSFYKDKKPYASVIGSSNLGGIFDKSNRHYECDVLFNKDSEVKEIHSAIEKLYSSIATDISSVNIEHFIEYNSLLENQDNVEKVSPTYFVELRQTVSTVFEIPVKASDTPKSNLNIFFGEGRKTPNRGLVLPRPWYEAELIVSAAITRKKDYPVNQEFWVITDDAWKFKCKTSGTNSKNFRSCDDLKILGKWIKGRLENNGALAIGNPVTDDTLKAYGRDSVTLSKTNVEDVWLLDFGV